MERPRLLLVPEFTELEWTIVPELEEWADVATYDAAGVGDEALPPQELEPLIADPRRRRTVIAERGLEEMARRGWERCVVVADAGSNAVACRLASMRPAAVQALALGHACLSLDAEGSRPTVSAEVQAAMRSLVDQDREEFVRHALSQLTGGSYDEAMARRILDRVPTKLLARAWLQGGDEPGGDLIRDLDAPLLFVKHEGCLMYTDEGFEDAVAAFPQARTASVPDKPSVSGDFAEELRRFCESLPSGA